MEGEMKNLIVLGLSVFASLTYSHTIAKFIPKGLTRFFAILPVIFLFLYLPLILTTVSFGSTISFLISWLANFKLLLFAFGGGPLSMSPSDDSPLLPLNKFILIACLPIKIEPHKSRPNVGKHPTKGMEEYPSHQTPPKPHKSPLNYTTKALLLGIVWQLFKYRQHLHPKILTVLYCLHIYTTLEFMLAVMAALARAMARLDLAPQFDEPYLASSLQDFWGKRWNLIVVSILRPTVYDPVRSIASRLMGRKLAPLAATLATFLVSGLMHELILYHVGRVKPTWEVLCFFLLHGVCLVVEICVKRALNGNKYRLPVIVSGPLVVLFALFTGSWLFIPPIIRCKVDFKAGREVASLMEFVSDVVRIRLS